MVVHFISVLEDMRAPKNKGDLCARRKGTLCVNVWKEGRLQIDPIAQGFAHPIFKEIHGWVK